VQSTRTGPALRSGIPVLTRHRPGAEVTTVTVWVLAGSRQEGDRRGATHLLEHVLMRADLPGLGQRPVHAIAALGGEGGAIAAREHLMLYARVPTAQAGAAADVLARAVVNQELPDAVVDAERAAVLAELRDSANDPAETADDVFFGAALDGHPLSRPVAGTAADVPALTRADLLAHLREHVHAGRVAAVVCGGVGAEEAHRRFATGPLADLPPGVPGQPPGGTPVPRAARAARPLDADTAVVLLGGPAAPLTHPRQAAFAVLMELVTGGPVPPLLDELRARRGVAHDLWGYASGYSDVGVWRVGLSTAPERVDEVVALARWLLGQQVDRGWTEAEVAAASRRMGGQLRLDLESTLEEAVMLGVHALVGGDLGWAPATLLGQLDAVTAADVAGCGAELLDRLVVAAAGGRPDPDSGWHQDGTETPR
jgi:predicted Zn-dependent peptidase